MCSLTTIEGKNNTLLTGPGRHTDRLTAVEILTRLVDQVIHAPIVTKEWFRMSGHLREDK